MRSKEKKLLFIEDDVIDQKAFKRFTDQGEFPYDFDISSSVKEAKKSLKSKKYDVVVADYSLGDGTAFDVLKILENIPMVILTGTGNEEIAVKAMKLGAYDYLIKDMEGNYLKMLPVTIENAIIRFHAEQKLQEYHENLEKLVDERTAKLKKEIIERKQIELELRQSEERFKRLFNDLGDAVYVTKIGGANRGRIFEVNFAAEKQTGYTRNELLKMNIIRDLYVSGSGDITTNDWEEELNKGEIVTTTEKKRRKDGTEFWTEVIVTSIEFKGEKASLSINHDITERKQAEEELKKHRDHLEEMVKERTKDLEAFSYSISHDLRAPLRAISGFSEILSKDYKDKLDEEANRLITIIRKNTLDMNQLITDLLEFSRLGRQQLKLVKIDMKILARDVFDELSQVHPKRNIKFEIRDIPDAFGDRNLVRLVFLNLISNAIKFTGPRKIAEIEIGLQDKNEQTFYYVKDNGVGFDMKYINRIFGVFQRLHSSEEFEGIGVGLAIVRKIIQNHGGKVMAEGEVDKGATFYFSLPKE